MVYSGVKEKEKSIYEELRETVKQNNTNCYEVNLPFNENRPFLLNNGLIK